MKKVKSKKLKPYKVKYKVSFDFIDVENGTFKESVVHKPWQDVFKKKDLLKNRRKAIRHYIDRVDYFIYSGTFNFISPAAFQANPNSKGTIINIILYMYDNQGNCFALQGSEPDELFEMLTFESNHLSNSNKVHFITVTDHEGNFQTVLKEDFQLFNLWFNN